VLRASCQASPLLREMEARNIAHFKTDAAETLVGLGLADEPRKLQIIAQIVIEGSGQLIDLAL